MTANTLNIVSDRLLSICDCQPVNIGTFAGTRTVAYVMETIVTKSCSLETVLQKATHYLVSEVLHATVAVMDDKPFFCAKQLVGDDE